MTKDVIKTRIGKLESVINKYLVHVKEIEDSKSHSYCYGLSYGTLQTIASELRSLKTEI